MNLKTKLCKRLSQLKENLINVFGSKSYKGYKVLNSSEEWLNFYLKAIEEVIEPDFEKHGNMLSKELTLVVQPYTSGHYFLYYVDLSSGERTSGFTIGEDIENEVLSKYRDKLDCLNVKKGFLNYYLPEDKAVSWEELQTNFNQMKEKINSKIILSNKLEG